MDKKTLTKSFLLAAAAGGIALSAHANSVIEPFGLLSENFNGTPSGPSTAGTAVGLSGAGSAYGSSTANADYVFSFTPGVTAENFSPAAGLDYGNGELATGLSAGDLPDGGTGSYRVFATWPSTSNVSGGDTTFTVTNDGANEVFVINQNDSAHGDGSFGSAPGGNRWLLLATVDLTAGQTYSVTMSPTSDTFVSMRSSGVMFEAIPEPSTYAAIFGGLALAGAFVYRRRARATKA